VLLGLVQDTEQCKLECRLFTKVASRKPVPIAIGTDPGTLVFFNGDRLYHRVSPLGEGEERVVLTLEC
jgi:hypothetical protein